MRLRLTGRHDSLLLAGLAFALLLVFQRSIQQLLDVARGIEHAYGVALVPALLILTVMFVFHQHAKRREIKAEAAAAAAEAAVARERAEELEQLMLFGQALARVLSVDALSEVIWRYLPTLSEGTDVWVLLRTGNGWDRLTDVGCARWPAGELEKIADGASSQSQELIEHSDGLVRDGHICFTMFFGTRSIGILGLPLTAANFTVRRKMAAAAALISIAARNAQLFAEVRDHSVRDALTGCFNRAHTLEVLDAELARSRRAGTPMGLLMFDVDQFKRINDHYGHQAGDRVLAAVGQRIRQVLRKSDVRCRYGGDEFLLVLPETAASGTARVAEWMRGEVENVDVRHGTIRVPVTASVGFTVVQGGDITAADAIERADQALYRAKADGRNCVRAFAPAAAALPVETPDVLPAAAMSAEAMRRHH
jgi:diguanylate cyclase (GGDEF)-like protein